MPKCYICKEHKRATQFNKDRTRPSGIMSKCKSCSKLRMAEKRKSPEGKEKQVRLSRRWKRNNKIKENAHKKVARAVKSGKLVKPERCSKCWDNHKIEGHHYDYALPLDVIWLCKKCHINLHREKYHASRKYMDTQTAVG